MFLNKLFGQFLLFPTLQEKLGTTKYPVPYPAGMYFTSITPCHHWFGCTSTSRWNGFVFPLCGNVLLLQSTCTFLCWGGLLLPTLLCWGELLSTGTFLWWGGQYNLWWVWGGQSNVLLSKVPSSPFLWGGEQSKVPSFTLW